MQYSVNSQQRLKKIVPFGSKRAAQAGERVDNTGMANRIAAALLASCSSLTKLVLVDGSPYLAAEISFLL